MDELFYGLDMMCGFMQSEDTDAEADTARISEEAGCFIHDTANL